MKEYTESQMSGAILNCYGLPSDTDLLETFPLLKHLPGFNYEFAGFTDPVHAKQCTIRYINYFYSQGISVLEADFPDFLKRKVKCADLAGFVWNEDDGRFSKKVEEILQCRNAFVNQMIISFVRHNYSDDYSALTMLREQYYAVMRDGMVGGKAADTEKLIKINGELKKLSRELLNNDESKELSMALITRIEKEALSLRPEDIAERISEGKSPIDFEVYA